MSDHPLTLLCVHAHPDDEASSTGGVLARYSAEGVTTIVVTCTDGALGDAPDGTKPEDPGHDEAAVVAHRHEELVRSCELLGVTQLVELGFADSGMDGWSHNERHDAFCQLDVAAAAAPLLEVLERYRPQVVVTYDERGFYGHPDHIQANRITLEALRRCSYEPKLFYSTIPRSRLEEFSARLAEAGVEGPGELPEDMGTPDDQIGAIVDCRRWAATKRAALAAHGSQTDSSFFLQLSEEDFTEAFGWEAFVSVQDPTGPHGLDDDLFARLR